MIQHAAYVLATQVETILGGLTEAATRLTRRDTAEEPVLGPREILALFSELSNSTARAAAVNPTELERLIGIIDAVEHLSRIPSAREDTPAQLVWDPVAFLPHESASVATYPELVFRPELLKEAMKSGLSTHPLLPKNFPKKPFKTDNPSFYLALQGLLSLCRSITSTEEICSTLELTIQNCTSENQGSSPRPIRISLKPEPLQTIPRTEILVGLEARDRLREEVRSRSEEITQPEFIEKVVSPLVFDQTTERKCDNYTGSIVHEIGSGRITVNYQFDGKTLAYGKLYSNENEALHCTRVIKELWNNGFDVTRTYRVPALLAYLPDLRLVITSAAEGAQFSSILEQGDSQLSTFAARQAARWLVELHRSPVRVGGKTTVWNSMELFRLLRRLAKAAARVPDQRESLVEMVERMCEIGAKSFRNIPRVQTHGKFHYEHVLIEGPTTTVIDFDGSFPSDPAVDLVEFLRVMRWRAYKMTMGSRFAEDPTRAFLEEYLRYLPENCGNLAVYWAASTLLILLRKAKKYDPEDDMFNTKMEFLKDELDSILSGKLPMGLGGEIAI